MILSIVVKPNRNFLIVAIALIIIALLCLDAVQAIGQTSFTPQPTNPLDLLPSGQETHTVLNSGNWSDTNTWLNGRTPTDQAKVLIPMGKTLTIDGEIPTRIKIIRNDGKLRFSTSVNTALNVETIVQGMMSELEIGTTTNPIPAGITCKITLIDEGDITDYTTSQFEKGLVLMGKTVMHGADKTDWLRVATNPAQGATSISLPSAPSGWEVGDRIVISGTTSSRNPTGDEVATIQSVSGNVVNLSAALTKDHSDVPASDLRVHVANLTRNIVIESENPDTVKLERGHIMFMHTLDVDMNNVRIHKMGRTNKIKPVNGWILNENPTSDEDQVIQGARTNIRGRYSIHFHRGGVDQTLSPAYVRGCVVENDPGWGYVNHSAYVHFEDNVSYDILGGAFQTEAGDELGSFKRNIAIRTINPNYPRLYNFDGEGPGDPDIRGNEQDFAFQGDAFWIHGGGVSLVGNVASGCSGHGFIYWPEGLREDVSSGFLNNFKPENVPNSELLEGNEEVATGWVPVKEFRNNEAYSAIIGFSSYYLQTQFFGDMRDYSDAYLATVHSTFENFTGWNLYWKGVEINLTERITFENLRVVNNDGHVNSIGVHNRGWARDRHIYDNATVEGFGIGMVIPKQGTITINCGTYNNQTNFEIPMAVQDFRDILFDGITTSNHSSFPSSNYVDIKMIADFSQPLDKHPLYFMLPDRITLNYGSFSNQRLYYDQQAASFIPVAPGSETSPEGQIIQSRFVNLSNQELQDTYQMSFGGDLLPPEAVSANGVIGGKISSASSTPQNMPTCVNYNSEGRFLKVSNFTDIDECIGSQTNLVGSVLSPFSHTVCTSSTSNAFPENAKIMPFGASRTAGGAEFESHRYELWKRMLDNSWTLDYIGTQTDEKTYPDYLGQAFDLDHAGFGGQNSTVLLDQVAEELSNAGIPDIVLFSAPGGNDALQTETFNTTTTFANINTIIDAFQAANPNVTIFIEQPAPVGAAEGAQANSNLSLIAVEVPNIATEQTTSTSDVIPVDLNSNWSDSWFASDEDVVHYNVAGAIEVANRYIAVMSSYYSGSSTTQYTLTTSATTGGSITPGGTYNSGTVVTITATPDEGYVFSNWSGSASG
ncbi:MAG: G8 domain-containing protein, partial [Bacteroidota bacterium]